MMFDDLPVKTFNPMKDVWFPLDLSNASSFNCIMAHSAAHLAHLQGSTSTEALQYKEEALRILATWFNDPTRALSDETFAAVIRLLTFEVCILTADSHVVHILLYSACVEIFG